MLRIRVKCACTFWTPLYMKFDVKMIIPTNSETYLNICPSKPYRVCVRHLTLSEGVQIFFLDTRGIPVALKTYGRQRALMAMVKIGLMEHAGPGTSLTVFLYSRIILSLSSQPLLSSLCSMLLIILQDARRAPITFLYATDSRFLSSTVSSTSIPATRFMDSTISVGHTTRHFKQISPCLIRLYWRCTETYSCTIF